MAKTISIRQVTNPVRANSPAFFTVTVTNGDGTSAELRSLNVYETGKDGAFVSQPNFLQLNAGPSSFPTLTAGASATYGFQVVFPSPANPGPSPKNQPGGARPQQPAFPIRVPVMQMRAEGLTSDGSVFSTDFTVAVLTALRPFPTPDGGAGQMNRAANSNLIATIL